MAASARAPDVDGEPIPVVAAERAGRLPGPRPLVIEGLAEGWPARRWTPEALAARFGDVRLPVARRRGGALAIDPRRGLVFDEVRLADYVAGLARGDESGYLMTPVADLPAAMRRELGVPAPVARAAWLRSKLWCSAAGTVSQLHRDVAHNLHTQLTGRKRFVLYAPRDDRRVYPHRLWSSVPNFARVDPERPDPARFPRFAKARPLVCELAPGQTVYIPGLWWHHVRTLETSVTVNFWWATGARRGLVTLAELWKRLAGISR